MYVYLRASFGWLLITIWLIMPTAVGATPSTQSDQLAASIEVLSDGVELNVAETNQWFPVTGRAVVASGDTIRTDAEGSAIVTWFSDGTVMEIAPNSEVRIDEFSGSTSDDTAPFRIETTVTVGRVFHGVRRLISPESEYQVNTPSLTAAVRGTVLAVDVTSTQATLLLVTEGVVVTTHTSLASQQTVEAGYWLYAETDTPLPAPLSIEDASQDPLVTEFVGATNTFDASRVDSDGDGIFDVRDACPTVSGTLRYAGCPPPQPTSQPTIVPTAIPPTAPPPPPARDDNDDDGRGEGDDDRDAGDD